MKRARLYSSMHQPFPRWVCICPFTCHREMRAQPHASPRRWEELPADVLLHVFTFLAASTPPQPRTSSSASGEPLTPDDAPFSCALHAPRATCMLWKQAIDGNVQALCLGGPQCDLRQGQFPLLAAIDASHARHVDVHAALVGPLGAPTPHGLQLPAASTPAPTRPLLSADAPPNGGMCRRTRSRSRSMSVSAGGAPSLAECNPQRMGPAPRPLATMPRVNRLTVNISCSSHARCAPVCPDSLGSLVQQAHYQTLNIYLLRSSTPILLDLYLFGLNSLPPRPQPGEGLTHLLFPHLPAAW